MRVALFGLLLALLVPNAGSAISCWDDDGALVTVFGHREGRRPLVVVTWGEDSSPDLSSYVIVPQGESAEDLRVVVEVRGGAVLQPRWPLPAERSFTVYGEDESGMEGGDWDWGTYRTGSTEPDPPEAPVLVDRSAHSASYFGGGCGGGGDTIDVVVEPDESVLLLAVQEDAPPVEAEHAQRLSVDPEDGTWSGILQPGATYPLWGARLGPGGASDWVELDQVTMPLAGCSASMAGLGSTPFGLFLGLVLLLLRRPRSAGSAAAVLAVALYLTPAPAGARPPPSPDLPSWQTLVANSAAGHGLTAAFATPPCAIATQATALRAPGSGHFMLACWGLALGPSLTAPTLAAWVPRSRALADNLPRLRREMHGLAVVFYVLGAAGVVGTTVLGISEMLWYEPQRFFLGLTGTVSLFYAGGLNSWFARVLPIGEAPREAVARRPVLRIRPSGLGLAGTW